MRGGHADSGKRAYGVVVGAFDIANDDGFHLQNLLHGREQPLICLTIGHWHARVAVALDTSIERNALVVGPQVLLCSENLKGLVFQLPHLVDFENEVGLVVTHFRLVRLEQEHRRRRIFVFCIRLVTHGLCHDARLLREMGSVRMVEIVRIFKCVGEHERWIELAIDVDHAVEMRIVEFERIVAAIEELDFRAEQFGSALGFVLAARLDLFQRGPGFLPGKLTFAALAVRQA